MGARGKGSMARVGVRRAAVLQSFVDFKPEGLTLDELMTLHPEIGYGVAVKDIEHLENAGLLDPEWPEHDHRHGKRYWVSDAGLATAAGYAATMPKPVAVVPVVLPSTTTVAFTPEPADWKTVAEVLRDQVRELEAEVATLRAAVLTKDTLRAFMAGGA